MPKLKSVITCVVRLLFAPEHLARTFWGVVVALGTFGLGAWYNSTKGPSKVIVTNQPIVRDTMIVRIEGQSGDPNQTLTRRIEQLVREVGSFRTFYSQSEKARVYHDSLKPLSSRPVKSYISSNQHQQPAELTRIPITTEPVPAQIKVPLFRLPSNIKGYYPAQLSSVARLDLPRIQYSKNDEIKCVIEFINPGDISRVTPLIVDVLRKMSENSYTLLYNQQFIIQPGKNSITLNADFGTGPFILQAGFYFLEELNESYPRFYRTQVECTVK